MITKSRCLRSAFLCALFICLLAPDLMAQASSQLGIFEGQSNIGKVEPPGTLSYDSQKNAYTETAAGANMWSAEDDFHFAWKKVSGDVSLTSDIHFPASTGDPNPHRKAVLMLRQDLGGDSIYADAALHGSGMTALQYRRAKGATTQDIELDIQRPRRLRLEKRGDTITMFLSMADEPLHQVGASIKLHLVEPFYAGIGVCSHNKDVTEKATFTNFELKVLAAPANQAQKDLYSTLSTIGIEDNFRRAMVITSERGRLEAPNWTRDGKSLIFNRDGHIWTIPTEGGHAVMIDTGNAKRCTGSHGLSPDGKWLAISCSTPDNPETRVYIVSATGGEPRLVTENPFSYFHSWSPNGKTIAFTRPNHGGGNIFSIAIEGGVERALTTGSGISDDPDYSADGKYIYFNSDRAGGSMEIWRMKPDGSEPEQVTSDGENNWTPHPSSDGKSILVLSYGKGVTGHPTSKDITFRILSPSDGKIRDLVRIVGGAGSDNVPNWAPDGTHFAFVSFQMLPAEETGSTE